MKLTIISNIPALIIDIWDGYGALVVDKKYTPSHPVTFENPSVSVFEFPKGLYQLRLSAPYHSAGEIFEMPLLMNETVVLNKDLTVTFNTQLKIA